MLREAHHIPQSPYLFIYMTAESITHDSIEHYKQYIRYIVVTATVSLQLLMQYAIVFNISEMCVCGVVRCVLCVSGVCVFVCVCWLPMVLTLRVTECFYIGFISGSASICQDF